MLLQHGGGYFAGADDMVPIGKWEEMKEDEHGLFVRGRLFELDTDRAKAVYTAIKEGELDGLTRFVRRRGVDAQRVHALGGVGLDPHRSVELAA